LGEAYVQQWTSLGWDYDDDDDDDPHFIKMTYLWEICTDQPALWARVVGYGPFSLCVIHKEGLCPSSGDIKRLMMVVMMMRNTADLTGGLVWVHLLCECW
jgi:hypothetical protein